MMWSQKRSAAVLGPWNPVAVFVAGAVIGGTFIVAWPMTQSTFSGATSAVLAYWSTMLTHAPTAKASVTTTFDINATLQATPKDAPVQNASVIACTYVLTDGHNCN